MRTGGSSLKGVTSEVIAEVRMRAGILEVISETVVLKRAGKDYKGLCPFHGEKTPSFHVNAEKGIFKCFGCGEGGDVFAFVQKTKGLEFIDSVRELARKYGVKLAESVEDRKEYDRRSQILMLYQQASEYYLRLLRDPVEGAFARKYLEDRGLSPETIEKFKLGYAPNSWDGLLRFLTEKTKVSAATLEEAGLVRRRQESSGHYDLFRNRLMIPICDSEGRVIAFGGRTLGDDQVKYLNSPETPIYHKGLHLFGFNLAKEAIKSKDSVIVVEGYFDAITSHQFGFTNTVATLGTALTEQQSKLLVRYTESKRVYLSFDADAAGVRAVERGIEMLSQIAEGIGIELRVIAIPGGKDPDECLRSGPTGVTSFQAAIDKAALMLDYQLEQAVKGIDLSSHLGRIDAARKIVPILAVMKNAVARTEYVRIWAMKLRSREEQILSDISQYRQANRIDRENNPYKFKGYQGSGYQGVQSQFRSDQRTQGQYRPYEKSRDSYVRKSGDSLYVDSDPFSEAGDSVLADDSNMSNFRGEEFEKEVRVVNPVGGSGNGKSLQSDRIEPPQYTNSGPPPFQPKPQQFGGFKKNNKNFKKGKNEKDIADEETMPMPLSAMGPAMRRGPISGSVEAERQILALCLTSREDYDIACATLANERFLSPSHQQIQNALCGVGTTFSTIEDLQYQLMDRLAPDSAATKALVAVILKSEEFRKQKVPVQVVLNESRARILKERLAHLITDAYGDLSAEQDESRATLLQGRIKELRALDLEVLPKIETLEDLEALKRKLDAIEDEVNNSDKTETHV